VPEQRLEHDLPTIDVFLQLDASLEPILETGGPMYSSVFQSVQQQLSDLIHLLGIPGRVVLEIGPLSDTRRDDVEWMRLRVNGALCRYAQEILAIAWDSAAGRVADAKPAGVRSRLQAPADAHAEHRAEQVGEFLGLVCREIVSRQPAVLLGPAHVVAYGGQLEGLAHDQQLNSWTPDTSQLMQILKRVLELRLSIADTKIVATVLADHGAAKWEDMVEHLVDALAPDVMELHVPEAYVALLTTADENGSDLLTFSHEGMFVELGVAFPPLRLVPDTELKSNSFTFMINHLPTLSVVGLEADECLVNDTSERLRLMEIKGREAVNPATQQPGAIVDVTKKEVLGPAGLTMWDQADYCILCFAEALRRNCACFVHRRSVEIQLEQLGQAFPVLVEAARAKVSVEKITRVLRVLGSEQVSIRNLRLILERFLDYQYRVSDLERYSILDDRLSISGYLEDWRTDDAVPFVRAGLKRQISNKYVRGTSTLAVYLVDSELEDLFNGANTDAAQDEERQEYIIMALANELNHLPPEAQAPPILTTIGTRADLRDAIQLTFPRISVLAYEELRPDLNIQPVARISLR
jgi:flagellar biosynthesis component FlhA